MRLNGRLIGKILSLVLLIAAAAMTIPGFIGLHYGEPAASRAFFLTALAAALIGLCGLLQIKPENQTLRVRDGFLVVTATWILIAFVGAFPLYFSGAVPVFCDALFESTSGITTTGATIIDDIDSLPHAVLIWRSLLHWLGGMGILVFAIALLPSLGIGGTQLLSAESSSPRNDKLSAKQSNAAKLLYVIYIGLTVLEIILLRMGNMDFFDCLNHALSTIATGGFSTHNASIAYFGDPYIEWVVTVFMLLAGIRFPLYFYFFRRQFSEIKRDTELKTYLAIWGGVSLFIMAILLLKETYADFGTALRYSAFQTAAIMTTTGFGLADYDLWPNVVRMTLFCLLFVGGCSGSTSGGVKVIRVMSFFKIVRRGLYLRIHPNAVVPVKIGGKALSRENITSITTFLLLYIGLCLFGGFVISFCGTSIAPSLSAAMSCLGNVGPGFGAIGPTKTYSFFPGWVKIFLSFYMMIGRLELFTIMTLFMPSFWNPNR